MSVVFMVQLPLVLNRLRPSLILYLYRDFVLFVFFFLLFAFVVVFGIFLFLFYNSIPFCILCYFKDFIIFS